MPPATFSSLFLFLRLLINLSLAHKRETQMKDEFFGEDFLSEVGGAWKQPRRGFLKSLLAARSGRRIREFRDVVCPRLADAFSGFSNKHARITDRFRCGQLMAFGGKVGVQSLFSSGVYATSIPLFGGLETDGAREDCGFAAIQSAKVARSRANDRKHRKRRLCIGESPV